MVFFISLPLTGIKIQSEIHDSTEDARAALQLYKHYKKLKESDKLAAAITNLYEIGKKMAWKVPVLDASP
jgi:PAB-dependent poly(A)-specific ribonuclease subunit 2